MESCQVVASFRPGQQHDAHEYLRYLISALQDASLRASGILPEQLEFNAALRRRAETSLVHRVFGGYLCSEVACPNTACGYASNSFDPMLDLSLELPGGVKSVAKAMRARR